MSFPSSFPYGSASSGHSFREAIASYRRAQYLVAGSAAASASEDSEESPTDEESGISPPYRFEDDLVEDDPTPIAPDDSFVDQFQWDSFDNTTPSPEPVSFSPGQNTRRLIPRASPSPEVTEGTPLLRPKISFSSFPIPRRAPVTSGQTSRTQTSLVEERRYVPGDESQRRPLIRRASTSSKSGKQHYGGQSTFGQTVRRHFSPSRKVLY
ncbi:hypothetical protein K435DRAFT_724147 [Dendrothele bispora CBS 962.96]|uniref:Uncharacterized protein n=1 Tax=Dendrothele bispora (strain CBS 962.96) TaxID=1314807 RepID=A0A4S8LYN2_DENBC|nr:hypothetical protein K435DRAFT_724147 [Dendrothele bispora CBS 962.96]